MSSKHALTDPLHTLRGIGERTAALLALRGLHTIDDLLRYLPRRYERFAAGSQQSILEPGQHVTVEGRILESSARTIKGRAQVQAVLACGDHRITLLWFRVPGNPSAFLKRFVADTFLKASGKITAFRDRLQIVHPETALLPAPTLGGASALEPKPTAVTALQNHAASKIRVNSAMDDSDDTYAEGDIRAIYAEIEGVRPSVVRRAIMHALSEPEIMRQLADPLPDFLRRRHAWPTLADALLHVHCPAATTDVETLNTWQSPAQQRLIYDELLLLQIALLQHKRRMAVHRGHIIPITESLNHAAKAIFPFDLTDAQQRVLHAIEQDLRTGIPMHRLVQGDVGCGKTAVALAAAAAIARAGLQTALLAPTELLAEQHAKGAQRLLAPHGIHVRLLVGGMRASERRALLGDLVEGRIHVLVGTHALLQSDVRYHALALAIIDEQHRFGVLQRARLLELGKMLQGHVPHMLVMTATPIPRTLALTAYGDLDVSVIDALPPGRTPITTRVFKESDRDRVYERVRHAVSEGRQAYVVFPLVEESDKEGITHLRAATTALEELRAGPLAGLSIRLLHGRMRSDEKEQVMQAFLRQEISVLVATTVIEVGIDVPNATVMVIEHAERFGLSQLHQLRGRVGRGSHKSGCVLIASQKTGHLGMHRLHVMQSTHDGFRIAEADLALRGPGDFIGTRQAGMPTFAVADLMRDTELLVIARDDAIGILEPDPDLMLPQHAMLAALLRSTWQHKFALAQVG